jgi:hypothetical protein
MLLSLSFPAKQVALFLGQSFCKSVIYGDPVRFSSARYWHQESLEPRCSLGPRSPPKTSLQTFLFCFFSFRSFYALSIKENSLVPQPPKLPDRRPESRGTLFLAQSFTAKTCTSVSNQRTLSTFRIVIHKKGGDRHRAFCNKSRAMIIRCTSLVPS